MKFKFLPVIVSCLLSLYTYAQDAKVSGVVTEESGEALISANVVIDASKGWAAVTDFDGKFSFF